MIIDALLSAEPHLKIAQRVFDPEQYLHLTDTIMPVIESSNDPVTNPLLHVFLPCLTLIFCSGT